MPSLFTPRSDTRLRTAVGLGLAALLLLAVGGFALARSDRVWGVGVAADQPIPFSHAIHAGAIGLDCRYCHAGVEQGAGAGMPTAETCLGCHRGARVLATRASPAPPMPSHRRPAAG